MAAVDPTYPLYPVAAITSAALLLLVLMTSFIRQSTNLAVMFLCFWLFLENLTYGINSIIWADNADIKLYVYCDIGKRPFVFLTSERGLMHLTVTHVQMVTSAVKPMATFLLTRQLHMIASMQSVDFLARPQACFRCSVACH